MFEPTRGGTRGGQAEFKWSDVSADKDRENYIGHSINAPTGRWQKNKDIHWYAREGSEPEEEIRAEIAKVKEAEAEALAAALGFAPGNKPGVASSGGPATGSNAIAPANVSTPAADIERAAEKAEKKRLKAERKEEKRQRKEQRRAGRAARHDEERSRSRSRSKSRPRRRDDRSLSPRRRDGDDGRRRRSLSRTPPAGKIYDKDERERERERDRRRWDDRTRRDRPGARWGRD